MGDMNLGGDDIANMMGGMGGMDGMDMGGLGEFNSYKEDEVGDEKDLTGDGGVLKKIVAKGSGWDTPDNGDEVFGKLRPDTWRRVGHHAWRVVHGSASDQLTASLRTGQCTT